MAYSDIKDPSAYFQALTYTGNGTTTNNVTNTGNSNLQPDWVWIKQRSATQDHVFTDSNRDGEVASGTNLVLTSNTSEAEASSTGFGINYATNGINFDAAWAKVNASGQTYVAWQWKVNGGTTSSNTDGTITSTVQANTDAGFNIVTYTGNGSNSNFAHGMGEQPDMVIVKNRDSAANWCVWHKDLTSSYYLQLDTTSSQQTGPWDGLDPNSGVVFVYSGGLVNASGSDYVAYIFKGKQGYSKFGKYFGSGGTGITAPFIYTGFKPAFILHKCSTSGRAWYLYDTKRLGYNGGNGYLQAQDTDAESSNSVLDITSNGFKLRTTSTQMNQSGATFIYMAFAENPFVTSTGIPTTAR